MDDKKTKNVSFEDERILPCPFCKEKAYWRWVVISRGANHTGVLPEGAELVKETHALADRNRILYWWERKGYGIHCKTVGCLCRTPNKGFKTLEEAIKAWNDRANANKTPIDTKTILNDVKEYNKARGALNTDKKTISGMIRSIKECMSNMASYDREEIDLDKEYDIGLRMLETLEELLLNEWYEHEELSVQNMNEKAD